ncbi:prepilin-type N-terminal cleavage/methylation domain-containing protein [Halanaerobium saccharolyticum]|uniref:Prepilin-type N-terminal cleavage/methylation domain-containing protein n=1 Tax=Halanaerobium saccharolyticum TaxID=43595 RepID=A0A4R6SAK4_9FIRM|nr:type II secretion system protein [Halanaerobium saccharolyticum]TDP96960.1 prepilin-type N-terminal cleavage/methylation domain-containing protein [Halanaerobium saccharolyticum]
MSLNKEKGFTLIELMLALAIVGIVVFSSTGMIVNLFNIVRPSAQRMNTKQVAEIRLIEIAKYVRAASNSDVDTSSNNISFNGGIILEYDDNKILINNNDGSLKKSIPNIKDFNIEDDDSDGVYNVTIEVCRDSGCDDTVKRSTRISLRNTSN